MPEESGFPAILGWEALPAESAEPTHCLLKAMSIEQKLISFSFLFTPTFDSGLTGILRMHVSSYQDK